MSEITLKAIEDLLDLKLEEKLDAKLTPINETLAQHTSALDGIAKDVKNLLNDKTVTNRRLGRLKSGPRRPGQRSGSD